MNAIEYANRASKLFAVPETATKIKHLSDSGSAQMRDIARVVSSDPGLAAHVLKLANSAVYRFSRKIEDLEKAIQIIGVNSVYEFALAFAVSDSLTKEHYKYIDVKKYWFQSLSCALFCREIAKICHEKDGSRLFMAGLFHNIGELAVLRINPTLARDCGRFNATKFPKTVQQELLGFGYAEISASLLQKWLLPDSIVSTVAMQHHDESPAVTQEIQILQLAYTLSMIITYPDLYDLELFVPEFLYTSLNISSEEIDSVINKVRTETEKTVHLFVDH
ncbi:HDOD domain-containing protein [Glaciecola sp. 1036]|uniref:HDOD domain-containing protein n=1 Tax=Alteromonadaceae TaxID=72275 RepID=UPI003D06F738